MVFVTGDTHGQFSELINKIERIDTKPDDVMVILGDAGINYHGKVRDKMRKEKLSKVPVTFFCIHGNHEMRPETISTYREMEWNSGIVFVEDDYPNLLFAKDGEIYDMEGNSATNYLTDSKVTNESGYVIIFIVERRASEMKYTSAEANKLLKKIEGMISDIERKESITSSFIVSLGEDAETLRPKYDYEATQKELEKLEGKVRIVKHVINEFNLTHTLPGFDGLTIDQALIYIPQLTERINKLRKMSSVLPKQRIERYNNTSIVDYNVSNYDIEKAEKDYVEAKNKLAALHLALDAVNNSEVMEINISLDD